MAMNWKVIYVASRQEKKVAEMLIRDEIDHYLPMIKKMRQWADRKKQIEVPLFNSYIFVKPHPSKRDTVLQVPGVVKYVRYNDNDAFVKEEEISLIRELIQGGRDVSCYDDNDQYSRGAEVEVVAGPMRGHKGTVLSNSSGQYMRIAFDSMSNDLIVKVQKKEIKKIG